MTDISFEGVQLGATGSLAEDLGRYLAGTRFPPTGQDQFVHEWLGRTWKAQGAEGRGALSQAVGSHLTSANLRVRSGAIRFFQRQRHADDQGALRWALENQPELFDGVEDPIPGAPSDLRMELARAIAVAPKRLSAPGAIDLLQAEALREEGGGGVVAGLFFGDRDWVMEHAEKIVQATPATYTTILLNLALSAGDLGPFVARMRSIVPDEAALAIVRERFATRDELLRTCLKALDAETVH